MYLHKAQTSLKVESASGFLAKGRLFLDLCLLNYIAGVIFTSCLHFGYT